MDKFDHERLRQSTINSVEPYGFWTWPVRNGRIGGMVCFRGLCRAGAPGRQDLTVINWWMQQFYSSMRFDSLVVDTWEFGGDWHDELTFRPPQELPASFRILYSVLPHHRERADSLWGDAVRDNLDSALIEIDEYLERLA